MSADQEPGPKPSGPEAGGTDPSFRYPERLGPFNIWIDESVYEERELALAACRRYAEVLETRRARVGRAAGPRQVADEEVVAAARVVLHSLESLWNKIRGQPGVAILGDSRLARQLVLASTVEWALEIVYQIRRIEREAAGPARRRWRVTGRAWRSEVSWSAEGLSRPFAEQDGAMSELALLEACAHAYSNCMATLVGWDELAAQDED
jgi:hypothetical protein